MKDKTDQMAEVFKALGDPTRLRIVQLLSSKRQVFCVGALAHKLGITQPAVSQHLKVLKNAGILIAHRKGFHVHYAFNPDSLGVHKKLIDELFKTAFECCCRYDTDQSCCQGNE
jgi:ArsR family transcriptional regulator